MYMDVCMCTHLLPVADLLMVKTFIVVAFGDELLRTSTGCTNPLLSSVLYTVLLKVTM